MWAVQGLLGAVMARARRTSIEKEQGSQSADWVALPPDVLGTVLAAGNSRDTESTKRSVAAFRLVCKSWRDSVDCILQELSLAAWPEDISRLSRFAALQQICAVKPLVQTAPAAKPGLTKLTLPEQDSASSMTSSMATSPSSCTCSSSSTSPGSTGVQSIHNSDTITQKASIHHSPCTSASSLTAHTASGLQPSSRTAQLAALLGQLSQSHGKQLRSLAVAVEPEGSAQALASLAYLQGLTELTLVAIPSGPSSNTSSNAGSSITHSRTSSTGQHAAQDVQMAAGIPALSATPAAGDGAVQGASSHLLLPPLAQAAGQAAELQQAAADLTQQLQQVVQEFDQAVDTVVEAGEEQVVVVLQPPQVHEATQSSTVPATAVPPQPVLPSMTSGTTGSPSNTLPRQEAQQGTEKNGPIRLCLPPDVAANLDQLHSLCICNTTPDYDSLKSLRSLRALSLSSRAVPGYKARSDVLGVSLKGVGALAESLQELSAIKAHRAWQLPPEVCSLTRLRALDVSKNVLACLPDDISNLQLLTRLDVSDCCLTALPEPLGLIQGLQVLQANGNPGLMLPLTLTALTSLSILALSFCHSNAGELLEVAPDAFAGSLQELHLQGNGITHLPASFSRLTSLRHLDLSLNCLEVWPSLLSALPSLTHLDVACQVQGLTGGISESDLGGMTALQHLRVSSNSLTQLPESLGNLKALTSLDVSTNLMEHLPRNTSRLMSLVSLSIATNPLVSLPPGLNNLGRLARISATLISVGQPKRVQNGVVKGLKALQARRPGLELQL